MNVFPVPESLATKYHGAGHALAAVSRGELVDFVYLDDIFPDYDGDARRAVSDPRIQQDVRALQEQGSVHIGMLSCMEFVEL